MSERFGDFYATLSIEYDARIRQLVPEYDEMVECIVEMVGTRVPRTVLDIGAGVGSISRLVLSALPGVHVTAIEPCRDMAAAARRTLREFGPRVALVEADIRSFVPSSPFDVVFSSLVLHNISPADKDVLAGRIHQWLSPGGLFVWADLIQHADPLIQELFVRRRKDFARAAGCPVELLEANFEKESGMDAPLTIEDSIAVGRRAGFAQVEIVWARDTFAVFVFRAARRAAPTTIDTPRLRLRPYEWTDIPTLHELWSDVQVREFLWDGDVISRERARTTVSDSLNDWASVGYGQWTMRLRDRPQVIGFCGFRRAAWCDAPELLCGLAPAYWHRGLATEAATAALRHGFESLGFERVVAATDPPNRASVRLMERLGMTFERRGPLNGRDTLFYSMGSDRFFASPGQRPEGTGA